MISVELWRIILYLYKSDGLVISNYKIIYYEK